MNKLFELSVWIFNDKIRLVDRELLDYANL